MKSNSVVKGWTELMQSQDTTCKVVVKVSKMRVLRAQGKTIKNVLNMLILVLKESRRI